MLTRQHRKMRARLAAQSREVPTDDDVLELRIHGVSNTSPASMLDLPAADVEEVLGDSLAGFWRPKAGALHGIGEGDRGWVRPGITREAYSWGGLARTSPGGTGDGTVSKVTSVLGRIGWALLLPFGLANVAYWTRDLGDEVLAPPDQAGVSALRRWLRRGLSARRGPAHGAGAGAMRLFGLGLTALTVVTACEVSMDLVGTQCYHDRERVCGQLPTLFNVLAPASQADRLVLTSLVPVLLLLGLWILSAVSRSRYERAVPDDSGTEGSGRHLASRVPVLATPDFWLGDRMVGGLAQLHLAVGLALVALAVAWPALLGTGDPCGGLRSLWFHGSCWNQAGDQSVTVRWLFLMCVVAAMIVLPWAAVVSCRRAGDAPDIVARASAPSTMHVLLAGGAVLLITEISVLFVQPTLIVQPKLSARIPLPGVTGLPTVVAVLLFGLVAGAFTARLDRSGPVWTALLLFSLAAVGVSPWFAIGPILVISVLFVSVYKRSGGPFGDRRWTAWAGTGPGIFLGAALLAQGLFSSLAVLGVGDWLNGANIASSLIDSRLTSGAVLSTTTDACGRTCAAPDPILHAPMPYVLFGTATIATLLLLLLVIPLMLALTRNPDIPEAPDGDPPTSANSPRPPNLPSPAAEARSKATEEARRRSRRFAAFAHRAEKLVALVVLIGLAMMFLVVMAAASGWLPSGKQSFLSRVTDLGTAGVVLLAIVVLGALVGGAATGRTRPLGLVWDLICFLPRAAHPFAPPCYAERAVPELSSRITWWLKQPDRVVDGRRRGGRRVVLSAHSLGGVLAVAVLLGRGERPSEPPFAVRFLTYGSQLRAYFGRIFPELLGPSVLGTPPARAAQLWTKDPWSSEIGERSRPSADESPASVVGLLTSGKNVVFWRDLWRRTDYIGFPVWAYTPPNDIDGGAEEIDHTGYLVEVMTHSDYPRSRAYESALTALAFDEFGNTPA